MSELLSFALFLASVLIYAWKAGRNTWWFAATLTVLGLFVVLNITLFASDYFTGDGINDAVLYTLTNSLTGAGVSKYILPGIGIVLGLAANATLAVLPPLDSLVARSLLLGGAIVLNALATGMYIGAGFGPGPRDGLMTGLHARTGWSLRGIRTAIEVSVLLIGWMMGGKFGVGTVLYALTIGPLIQLCLPWFHQPAARKALAKPGEAIS